MRTARDRWPQRAHLLVAITVAAVFLIGAIVGGVVAPDQQPPAAKVSVSDAGSTANGAGPSSITADGLPIGWSHDTAGATAAATADATANQAWLYMDDDGIRRSVTAIAATDSTDSLIRYVLDAVRPARTALRASPGQVWWVVRPLATRVVSLSGHTASVAVWAVSILSAADVAMPQSTWVTTTVDLVWERGDWRLSSLRDRPGPTPQLDSTDRPWQPEDLEKALAGFRLLPIGAVAR